jgi:hypothetical protein
VTAHRNPDQSLSEGVKVECNGIFVAHAFIASIVASTGLTGVAGALAAGANQAIVQAQTAAVSYRLDGTAPTAGVGVQIPINGTITLNMTDAAAALFISASGSLAVTFTM